MSDRSSCGCRWERSPDFGDVIVEPCRDHDRGFMGTGEHRVYAPVGYIQHQLDRELDEVVRRGMRNRR